MRITTRTWLIISIVTTLSCHSAAHAGEFGDLLRFKTEHAVASGVAHTIGQNAAQATHQGIQAGVKKLFGGKPVEPAPTLEGSQSKETSKTKTDEKR